MTKASTHAHASRRWSEQAKALLDRVRGWAPPESRILVVALGIVLSLWVFLVMAGLMTTGRTQAFDERVLLALRQPHDRAMPVGPHWVQASALEFTALGSGPVLVTIILMVVGYLAIERRFAMIGLMLLACLGGMILSEPLKWLFMRPRPTIVPPLAIVHSTSFPSGHSMAAAVVYLTLGALLARTTTRWRLRLYFLGSALALSGLVGLSRMYLGVHYPTDVVAGWAAGVSWALLCELVAQRLQRRGVVTPPTR